MQVGNHAASVSKQPRSAKLKFVIESIGLTAAGGKELALDLMTSLAGHTEHHFTFIVPDLAAYKDISGSNIRTIVCKTGLWPLAPRPPAELRGAQNLPRGSERTLCSAWETSFPGSECAPRLCCCKMPGWSIAIRWPSRAGHFGKI